MIKYRLKRYSNIESPLGNSEIILVTIKQKKPQKTFVFKHQNVNCKTYDRTSTQAKNCARTYTLVVNKLKRIPSQEVLGTAHIKLFPPPLHKSHPPSSWQPPWAKWTLPILRSLPSPLMVFRTRKYLHFSTLDFYDGLECELLIFHRFDANSCNVAFCCGKTCAFSSVLFSLL